MPISGTEYEEFVGLFKSFLEDLNGRSSGDNSAFRSLLEEHLGEDPTQLPIVSDSYGVLDHPNLQLAIDDLVRESGTAPRLYGILGGNRRMMGVGLRDILSDLPAGRLAIGPVEYDSRPIGVDESQSCVMLGLYLLSLPDGPVAMLIHGEAQNRPMSTSDIVVDVTATREGQPEAVLADLRRRARERNVYRRQMFSLGQSPSPFGQQSLGVTFHPRPTVGRSDIVMSPKVLDRIERHVMLIGQSRERLLRVGRHLKRGLLLHGAPGTGKTLTIRYLAAQMTDATIIVLSGTGLGAIATTCAMARELAPSVVVIEDVDLVAQDRAIPGPHGQPLLFQLMNEIEGIAEDVDVAFILTTNRAEVLEPALAARPGRVDLAIELERPDAQARRQLIELYGSGIDLAIDDWDELISRTEGVTPAFIKEWLRSAVLGSDETSDRLGQADLSAALDELLDDANSLTRVLLGGAGGHGAEPAPQFPGGRGAPGRPGVMPGPAGDLRRGPSPPR